jgi:hypothetical protein
MSTAGLRKNDKASALAEVTETLLAADLHQLERIG